MVPKSCKFPLRTEFLRFRSRAKKYVTPLFTIYYLLTTKQASRLATIVPKKVSKLATTRNFFKRIVYDVVWKILKAKNLDCVVIFKPTPLLKDKKTKEVLIHELSQITNLL